MYKPKVVWALQAPTLLNRLAASSLWDLQVLEMDGANVSEKSLMDVKPWDGVAVDVDLVFVCTPGQVQMARSGFPTAKIVQVAHQGYRRRVADPKSADRILCFSKANARQLSPHFPKSHIATVLPFFEPAPKWGWRPNLGWTALSRPWTRHPVAASGVRQILFLSQKMQHHQWNGEGQGGGFLNQARMEARLRSCSCYLTVLPPKSGFGLTEHECMEAGVPLVGARWGDLADPDAQGLALYDYWEDEQIANAFDIMLSDARPARIASQAGLDYIATSRTKRAMDLTIQMAIELFL